MAYQFLPLALIILGLAGIVVLAGRHWSRLRQREFWRGVWHTTRPPAAGWGPLIFVWRWGAEIGRKVVWRVLRAVASSVFSRGKMEDWAAAGRRIALQWRHRWRRAGEEREEPVREEIQKPPLPKAFSPSSRLLATRKRAAVAGDILRQVERLIKREHWGQAERILIEELSRRPRLAPAYHLLGEVYIKGERWDEAIEVFEELVKRHENDAAAWGKLGKLYARKGDLPQAIKALQQAHDLDERNAEYLRELAEIALRMDNVPLARVTLEKLLALEPENTKVQRQLQELEERYPV